MLYIQNEALNIFTPIYDVKYNGPGVSEITKISKVIYNGTTVFEAPGLYQNGKLVQFWSELLEAYWTVSSNGILRSKSSAGYPALEGDLLLPYDGSIKKIGGSAFKNCRKLTSVTMPTGVTSIGEEAFYFCTSLSNIIIPDSVIEIQRRAFMYCSGLTSITIPYDVIKIGDYAFYGCTKLTSVDIYDNMEGIGSYAFAGCTSLTRIEIPDSVTSMGNSAFAFCSNLAEVVIGRGLTNISSNAFNSCKKLTSIGYWGSGVQISGIITSIDDYAFANCTGLIEINMPDSITNIGNNAFAGCSGLVDELNYPIIGKGVKTIGNSAFYGCTGLISMAVPDNVTSIGMGAFAGCTSLRNITLPFVGGSIVTSSKADDYPFGYIFGDTNYEGSIAVNQNYQGSGGETSATYYIPANLYRVTIKNGDIPLGAFSNCTNLRSINIPHFSQDNQGYIGNKAFYSCIGLTSIDIPKDIWSIGAEAFYGCLYLANINFEGTYAEWNSISKGIDWDKGAGQNTPNGYTAINTK